LQDAVAELLGADFGDREFAGKDAVPTKHQDHVKIERSNPHALTSLEPDVRSYSVGCTALIANLSCQMQVHRMPATKTLRPEGMCRMDVCDGDDTCWGA
jgi:hypothetical protein